MHLPTVLLFPSALAGVIAGYYLNEKNTIGVVFAISIYLFALISLCLTVTNKILNKYNNKIDLCETIKDILLRDKEFEKMAEENEFTKEVSEVLKKMNDDEKKRQEYEAREKAIRDYNTQMYSAEKRGIEAGLKIGEERGIEAGLKIGEERGLRRMATCLKEMGMQMDQIAHAVGREEDEVRSWLKEK